MALAAVPGASSLSSFTDPAGDSGGAPDVTAVSANNDASGTVTIDVVTNQTVLQADAVLLVLLDADQNAGTGSDGIEYIFALGATGYEFATWDGASWVSAPDTTVQVFYSPPGVARFVVNKSELGNTSGIDFSIASLQLAGDEVVARDLAPDGGWYSYVLTAPPAATPPPPPAVDVGKITLRAPGIHAGKVFSISAPVDTDASSVKVACAARVGARVVRMSARYSAASGTAACTGIAPKDTAGKRLTGTMTATISGDKDMSAFAFAIRK